MKNICNMLILIATLITTSGCSYVTVYYRVIDGDGTPVPGVDIRAGYTTGGGWTNKPTSSESIDRLTDNNGIGAYKGFVPFTAWADIDARFKKIGYYTTYAPTANEWTAKKGQWGVAEHAMVITFKKVKNPIPMYRKLANVKLPPGGGTFGYDLIVGDLVKPYGTGKESDLIFHATLLDEIVNGSKRVLFDITFSKADDGIQPVFIRDRVIVNQHYEAVSAKFDYNAPTTGYHKSLVSADDGWREKYKQEARRTGITRDWSEEVNYYIRVRSNTDGSAMYGWVNGFFRVLIYNSSNVSDIPHIEFEYAVNPEGTTNIEFLKNLEIKIFRENNEYLTYR